MKDKNGKLEKYIKKESLVIKTSDFVDCYKSVFRRFCNNIITVYKSPHRFQKPANKELLEYQDSFALIH